MRNSRRLDANNYSLFIVTDGKLQVTRNNTLLLVITGSVTSQLKNLGCEVFEDGSEIYYTLKLARYDENWILVDVRRTRSTSTNTLSVVSTLQ